MTVQPVQYAAAALGIVPLCAVGIFRPVPRVFWLVASAFAVSFVADVASFAFTVPDLIGNLYPLLQTGLLAIALWPVERAVHLVGFLGCVAVLAVFLGAATGHDLLLATTANALACLLALRVSGSLRASLLVTFGVGGLCWLWYGVDPGWPSWLAYQGARLVGTGLFVWAATAAT